MGLPKIKDTSALRKRGGGKKRKNPIESASQYLKDVRSEFRKVIWPGRAEIAAGTIVVLTALAFFVAFTGIADFIFQGIIKAVMP